MLIGSPPSGFDVTSRRIMAVHGPLHQWSDMAAADYGFCNRGRPGGIHNCSGGCEGASGYYQYHQSQYHIQQQSPYHAYNRHHHHLPLPPPPPPPQHQQPHFQQYDCHHQHRPYRQLPPLNGAVAKVKGRSPASLSLLPDLRSGKLSSLIFPLFVVVIIIIIAAIIVAVVNTPTTPAALV